MTPLSVLTLNIWNYEGEWSERRRLIRDWIRLLDPDLLALQEVLRGPSIDQVKELLDGTPYHVHYEPMFDYWDDPALSFGTLVAARWPLAHPEVLWLPPDGGPQQRNAVSVDVETPGGTVSFTTTHLSPKPWHPHLRTAQAVRIAQLVERRAFGAGVPALVCGDFNAQPDSDEVRFLKGLHTIEGRSFYLVDAWEAGGPAGPGLTYSAPNLGRAYTGDVRIDYVFVSPTRLRVQTCHVVCDLPRRGLYPSDHFGVYAELLLEPASG